MGEELTKNNYNNNYVMYVDINEIAKKFGQNYCNMEINQENSLRILQCNINHTKLLTQITHNLKSGNFALL